MTPTETLNAKTGLPTREWFQEHLGNVWNKTRPLPSSHTTMQDIAGASVSEDRRAEMIQFKQTANSPSFCSLQALRGLERCPSALVRVMIFTQFPNSNANPFGNTLTDTPENNVRPAIRSSLSPVKLTHTINHHWPVSI